MTVQEETAEAVPEIPVMFMGREIYSRMPTPEQLLVWQRTVKRLTEAPIDASWTGSEVMVALDRLLKIINSLMANKVDVEWLDDEFLEGRINFQTLGPFITLVTEAYAKLAEDEGNRETRRAAAKKVPAKKAARKKASTPR